MEARMYIVRVYEEDGTELEYEYGCKEHADVLDRALRDFAIESDRRLPF